jgi:hypothetical protein
VLLAIDLDVLFGTAIGNGDHDAKPENDRQANQGSGRADARQDPQFPQRSQNTTDQDGESDKIHSRKFHSLAPGSPASSKLRRTGEEYSRSRHSAREMSPQAHDQGH